MFLVTWHLRERGAAFVNHQDVMHSSPDLHARCLHTFALYIMMSSMFLPVLLLIFGDLARRETSGDLPETSVPLV